MDQNALLIKYKYASNTTKTAIEKGYKTKEVLCCICNKPISLEEAEAGIIEYSKSSHGHGVFFHRQCYEKR